MGCYLAHGWTDHQIATGIPLAMFNEMNKARIRARKGQDLLNHKIRWPRATARGLSSRNESSTETCVAHAPNLLTTGSAAP
eukprot:8331041-Pyramimonas_sp.AAC.1